MISSAASRAFLNVTQCSRCQIKRGHRALDFFPPSSHFSLSLCSQAMKTLRVPSTQLLHTGHLGSGNNMGFLEYIFLKSIKVISPLFRLVVFVVTIEIVCHLNGRPPSSMSSSTQDLWLQIHQEDIKKQNSRLFLFLLPLIKSLVIQAKLHIFHISQLIRISTHWKMFPYRICITDLSYFRKRKIYTPADTDMLTWLQQLVPWLLLRGMLDIAQRGSSWHAKCDHVKNACEDVFIL